MATKDVTVDGPVSLSSESTSPGPLDTNQEKPSVQETEEKAVVSEESPAETESQKETEFKEGGYGWIVVLAAFLVNAHTWGLNSSYSVFLAYYLRSGGIEGASPLGFAFVGGLSISMSMLISPFATWSIGRFGTLPTMRAGAVLVGGSFIAASFATHIWHLILSQGVCFGFGMGLCSNAPAPVIPQWFDKKRSFANAIATAGSGFGGLVYSLATNAMISNLGLAWAFRILAIVAFVVNAFCSLIMRDRNKEVGSIHVAFHRELLRYQEVWLLMAWGIFSILGYIILIFSITDYAQTVGFTAGQGSLAAAMFNLSQGIGRPIIGFASDHLGRFNVAAIGTLIAALASFFLWIFAGVHFGGLIVFSLFGAFAGIIWPCLAPIGTEVVGLPLLPSLFSIFWFILLVPATFAEVIGLSLRTSGQDAYLHVQVFTGAMYVAAFISLWLLRSWKIKQLDLFGLNEEHHNEGSQATGQDGAERTAARRTPSVGEYLSGLLVVKRI